MVCPKKKLNTPDAAVKSLYKGVDILDMKSRLSNHNYQIGGETAMTNGHSIDTLFSLED